ncbi:ribosomal-protein-alanine acetyltransferase [Planctomycetota bacterium]|nr:ribosomal-protein-alanine acetyltransferase [Planctomycetota bacterium]
MSDSIIRRASPADLAEISALEIRCFPAADRFPRRSWRYLLGSAASTILVVTTPSDLRTAVDENAAAPGLVGVICLICRQRDRVARIYSVAVDPSCQGRGLGRKLIAAAVAALPERIATLSLEVRTTNTVALGLYQRLGFVEVKALPGYYFDGSDGLRLRAARAEIARKTQG